MRPLYAILFLGLGLVATGQILGQVQKVVDSPRSIDDLVADLGHPVFSVREKAQRDLWSRGDAVIPALEKALRDENPEVVQRARELLEKFSWGLRPDTPPEVLKLLRQFQIGDKDPRKSAEQRKAAVLELLKFGPKGVSVARALLGKDFTPDVREQLVAQSTALLRREVPLKLFEGKTEAAAELISLHLAGTSAEGAADYAMFQILNGSLPAAVALTESKNTSPKQLPHQKQILSHLYRANNDWSKARAAATGLPVPAEGVSPVELLREDEGDWNTLADTVVFSALNHPDAVRLTYLRLAGRQKELEEAIRGVKNGVTEFSSAEEVFEAAVALFAIHRTEDATRMLLERKKNLGLLGDVLTARLQYRKALGLLDSDEVRKGVQFNEQIAFDLRRARILMLTGNRDGAVQLYDKVAQRLAGDPGNNIQPSNLPSIRSLLRSEMRMGLKELAVDHAGRFLAAGAQTWAIVDVNESLFETLFGQDGTSAETIFQVLRAKQLPGETASGILKRVRLVLTGKAEQSVVNETIKILREFMGPDGAARVSPAQDFTSDAWRVRKSLAIATLLQAAGRDEETDEAFRLAAELTNDATDLSGARTWVYGVTDATRPYVGWGDFLYERGRYAEAAIRFLQGWKRFPDQPLLLFLSGKALAKSGNIKEGERRRELAHWVALGQERIRGKFLDELVRRGEAKAAKREIELVQRGCWFHDHYFGNAMNQASQAAVLNGDFATAEKCRQRSLLVILKTPDVYFVETASYMTVPHDLLAYRARAHLAAGRIDEALAVAHEVLAITPGHVDLISGMVPKLDLTAKKSEADKLFQVGWSAYEKVLEEFPKSASAHNSLAMLAANCHRELDRGLEHAVAAVKLEPSSIPNRETLAEVHFRKGDRTQAIAVMTVLSAEEPRNRLYQRQLVRYRSGAFDSPKPDQDN